MSEPAPAMGIDLGTTTCAAARLTAVGELSCYLLEDNRYLLPSALHIGDAVVAGEAAFARALDDADGLVDAFKRDMGQPHFNRQVRGHWVPPEVLSALLLEAIRKTVQADWPTRRAVITVPAYFDERRRKATLEAGRLAGIDVIDIVNEPVAAALAELHHAGRLNESMIEATPSNVVVYDLGGGTFDVSVLRVEGPEITTLASDGDVRLGGRDFDQRIVDYIAERFRDRHGLDPRSDFTLVQRLWRLCERAKHELTAAETTSVNCSLAGKEMSIGLSRAGFVGLIAPLLERTLATSTDALEQAGLTWDRVDQILLVGGSSRIPAVAQMVEAETGIKPTRSHDPDLAVARGAALFAALDHAPSLSRLTVVNVNAHSLGVAGVDPRTGMGVNRIIIPRNSRLPAAKRQKFVTKKAGQKTIKINIVEGENENPDYCVPVGACVATLSPNLPAQTEVIVTCRLGTNGTLSVSCLVPATDEGAHVEIRRDGLLELESLDVWKNRLLGRNLNDQADEKSGSVAELPYAPPVDKDDEEAMVRRVDYLCQSAADLYSGESVSQRAGAARDQWFAAEQEHGALEQILSEVLRDRRRETDQSEQTRLQAAAAALRVQLREAENLLRYSKVAFGGLCLATEKTLPDAEEMADEFCDLRAALDE
ncbi:Hsp70 family protein [Botrimarina mediterranea]|uniref:Chaperone protein DnaK n=1 Tax=Botrimarina mediterranea TaxID=2528022 RepID=A0A518K5E1_9BACT|nr:Hsp70 family protein [Botrimarina mediterranea]QDV72995.1 Chaperone protein DnaK [Botrimarina mediterranea]QDV77569.1 Chaperone protein DnaK [Planctomycetes bacterium K2D]